MLTNSNIEGLIDLINDYISNNLTQIVDDNEEAIIKILTTEK